MKLQTYIQSYFGISETEVDGVASLFERRELKKNDFLLKMNQYSSSLSFVRSGYLRMYAYSENADKEVTQWISGPGSFTTDLSSFLFDQPSRWNIQALSDCELYTLSAENRNRIGEFSSNWDKLEKLFIAKCFVTLENRVFQQLSMTAEEKYLQLFHTFPEIFNHVPLQYIASMMGMTPETLSRIRRKQTS